MIQNFQGHTPVLHPTARAADSWLEVTLTAECREEIGRERETGAVTDGPEPEENGKTGRAGENT